MLLKRLSGCVYSLFTDEAVALAEKDELLARDLVLLDSPADDLLRVAVAVDVCAVDYQPNPLSSMVCSNLTYPRCSSRGHMLP